jgi:hypothetical protein
LDNLEELNLDLRFYKLTGKSKKKGKTNEGEEVKSDPSTSGITKEPLRICDLPSFSRICLNFIALETNKTKGLSSVRTGYVIGSISFSIFEINHMLKTGQREYRMWAFQSFDPLIICKGECNTIKKTLSEEEQPEPLILTIKTQDRDKPVVWGMPHIDT